MPDDIPAAREVYHLGELTLDVGARRLERSGDPVTLPSHAFDVLVTLVRRSPDAVSTEQLLDTVWPGISIGEENVKQQVMLLRRALGDDAETPQFIETVRGYGYRLARQLESAAESSAPCLPTASILRPHALAVGVLMLVVGGLAAWHVAHRWTNGGNDTGQRFRGPVRNRVLVGIFENRTGDARLDALALQISERIAAHMAASQRLEVVAATAVGLASARSTAPALERARRARAAWLLDGSIERSPENAELVRIDAALIESADGVVITALPTTAVPNTVGRKQAIDRIVDATVTAVAAALDPSLAKLGPGASRPISLEAYDEYALGVRRFRARQFADALDHFERAAGLDGRFGGARLMALLSLINLARLDEARRAAAELEAVDLPPFDRDVLRYCTTLLAGDWGAHLERARELARLAPDSAYVFGAGAAALLVNRPREAIARLEAIDPDGGPGEPWLPYWYYLSLARHALGQTEAELDAAREARRRFPSERAAVVMQVRGLAVLGDERRIVELLHAAAVMTPEPGIALRTVAWVAASELAAHGYLTVARRVAAKGLTLRAEREAIPADERDRARLLSLVGRHTEAARLLQSLRQRHPERLDILGENGLASLTSGDVEAAEAIRRRLARHSDLDLGESLLWQAALAAVSGEDDMAAEMLERAVGEGFPTWHTPNLRDISFQIHAHPAFHRLFGDERFRTLLWPDGRPDGWHGDPTTERPARGD